VRCEFDGNAALDTTDLNFSSVQLSQSYSDILAHKLLTGPAAEIIQHEIIKPCSRLGTVRG